MKYKGRNVFRDASLKRYPSVYWPQHPRVKANGCVYVHHAVVYDHYGDIGDKVIHHKDENIWNWSLDNLEILGRSDHTKIHNPKNFKENENCLICDSKLPHNNIKYCSLTCAGKANQKIKWPALKDLISMIKELGYEGAGRSLGVSGTAVRKRVKTRGLQALK